MMSPADTPPTLLIMTECPLEQVIVTNVRSFQDPQGAWRVVGLIENRWDQAVSKLVTSVEAISLVGEVIDHGEDISAYPLNLTPGGRAPFSAWIKRDFPGVDHFRVSVEECVAAEKMARAVAEVRGERLLLDGPRAHIIGELVNPGASPILVNGLMGWVSDATGAPLSADYAAITPRYLMSGERGPVRVSLDLPPGSAQFVKDHSLYMDVIVAEARTVPFDPVEDVTITSRYMDTAGRFHLVGELTNRGERSLMLRLQATLYEDPIRSRLLDAATFDTMLPLIPGESRPFDFIAWAAADGQPSLAAEQVHNDAPVTVRYEPLQSWTSTVQVTGLAVLAGPLAITGQEATLAATVSNNSGGKVAQILVTAVMRDRKDGRLLATGSTRVNLLQGLAPAQTLESAVTIPLWPGFTADSVVFGVAAYGQ